jgi:hypothetical protein
LSTIKGERPVTLCARDTPYDFTGTVVDANLDAPYPIIQFDLQSMPRRTWFANNQQALRNPYLVKLVRAASGAEWRQSYRIGRRCVAMMARLCSQHKGVSIRLEQASSGGRRDGSCRPDQFGLHPTNSNDTLRGFRAIQGHDQQNVHMDE